ncbi:transcriptional regulator [Magnetospirillum moscoviense]|uniref:Transcriptional regulator n=1 Tax=Magnetospirillum moscoviense TaxID=1437059 RepID=A0A178MTJ9_9PROT|nr:transcriptional regulator [Magnetospirillum moscoviense]
MPPVHPGDVLRHEYLEPAGMSVYRLAEQLRVPRSRMNEIVQGRRSVTAETALRLARLFETSADFWLGLQAAYDLETTRLALGEKINAEVRPHAA